MRGSDNVASWEVDVTTAHGRSELDKLNRSVAKTSDMTGQEVGRQTGLWAGFGASVGMVVAGLISQFAGMAKAFTVSSLQIALKRESIMRSFEVLLGGADKASAAFERLQKAAKLPGVTFQSALSGAQKLLSQADPLSFEDTVRVIEQFGNAAALGGQSAYEMELALRGLGQMMGKNKISGEEMNRQILEAIPMLRKGLQAAFDTTNVEALAKKWKDSGESINSFILQWVDGLEKSVPSATATGALAIQNFGIAWDNAKAAFGRGLLGDDVIRNVDEFAEAVENVTDNLEDLGKIINRTVTPQLSNMIRFLDSLTDSTQSWKSKLEATAEFLMRGFGKPPDWLIRMFGMDPNFVDYTLSQALDFRAGGESTGFGGGSSRGGGAGREWGAVPPPSTRGVETGTSLDGTRPTDAKPMADTSKQDAIRVRGDWISKLEKAKDLASSGHPQLMNILGYASIGELDFALMAAYSEQYNAGGIGAGEYFSAVADVNDAAKQAAQDAADEASQQRSDAKRADIMGGRDRIDFARSNMEIADLTGNEKERARAVSELTAALDDQIGRETKYGDLIEANYLKIERLRLAEDERKKASLGEEILGARSPGAVEDVLRRNGIGGSSYTGFESVIGGAMSGDFGNEAAGRMSNNIAKALASMVAELLINSMRGHAVLP